MTQSCLFCKRKFICLFVSVLLSSSFLAFFLTWDSSQFFNTKIYHINLAIFDKPDSWDNPVSITNITATMEEYLTPHQKLLHPSKCLRDLWFKLSDDLVIRRLGYFDTREKSHIAVVFLTMFDVRKIVRPTLYANLVYSNDTKHCVKLEKWVESGKLDGEHKEFFVTVMYRSKAGDIPTSQSPLLALIGNEQDCTRSVTLIPIQDNMPKQRLTYGVCLHKGLYNLNDPQLLADWVDLHIALGAEIITVYLQNVSESYFTVMKPYIDRGIVEVLDWNFRPPLIPGYTKDWGQTGTVNECIYRNLYRVKYLALLDVDEFIVPQEKSNVIEMLHDLEEYNKGANINPGAFLFYNTYFYDKNVTLPEVDSATKCPNKKWPRYYTYTYRVADPVFEHKSFPWHKMIVKTAAVNAAWYHWPISYEKGYHQRYNYVTPVNFGLTHHYRAPSMPKERCNFSFIMSRYFAQTLPHLQDCYYTDNYDLS